jgi:hypothetical protein
MPKKKARFTGSSTSALPYSKTLPCSRRQLASRKSSPCHTLAPILAGRSLRAPLPQSEAFRFSREGAVGKIHVVGRSSSGIAGKQNLGPAPIPIVPACALPIRTRTPIHRLGRPVSIVHVFLDAALVQTSEHRVTKQRYDGGSNKDQDLCPRAKRTKYRNHRRAPGDDFEERYNESLDRAQDNWPYIIVAGLD